VADVDRDAGGERRRREHYHQKTQN
jgi:hypothetical protein